MARSNLPLPVPFEEIMSRHERGVMRFLLRVSKDREDAADLFQETWLRAYRAYPRLDPERDVRPWLYAIALNLCRNRARDGVRREQVITAVGNEKLPVDGSGKVYRTITENDGYAVVHLQQLMFALPAKQREALHLRYFAGLDYAEIAATMDCSQQSARANVSQAMRKLKSIW
jgi:RNA polymerase sigma-70 factor (ECF subfamily)